MNLDKLKTFIDAMAATDLAEMSFSEGGWTLRLSRGAASHGDATPAAPNTEPPHPVRSDRAQAVPLRPKPAPATGAEIRAPMPGVVHLRPAPDRPEFVSAGSSIAPGAVVCLIEAMKTFLEVRAERGGSIDAILVASGDEVEHGQPLMRIG
jgi:acetyl-CoA carboxylase biotin carboxyl carrier protein